ncbi:MAG: sulfatase [Bacteroidales bacterium]|jgi:arylsulfatase A-like enzyme|nr:sulfatase [Bacteroidales bacterium]
MTLKRAPVILIIAFLQFCCSSCIHEKKEPLNIVFILVDDLGWTDLGCYGSTFYETPHIDLLASESILFTNAYAASPVCSPTRAAIMTGKYPVRLNITDWIPGDDPHDRKLRGTADSNQLSLDETTLAEVLSTEGYKTFFAGKWHLGDTGYFPEDQGFDLNIGGHHRGSPPGGYYVPYKNPKMKDGPDDEYLTDRLTDESIQFLKGNRGEPFLLFLSFYTVHTPIQANKDHVDHYRGKVQKLAIQQIPTSAEHKAHTTLWQANPEYASMVHALDENVGRLTATLEELGLDEHTIVVFTSDNGGLSTITNPEWVAPTSVKPLRAGKGWCYEGGIRVPLLIRVPGSKSTTSGIPAISMDLFPTILELAGIDIPDDVDGQSLKPVFTGDSLARVELFWHYPHYHSSGWTPGAAIRAGNWKLIAFYDLDKVELYNLEADPGENNDLADSMPEKVIELKIKLQEWQTETGAMLPESNVPTQ